jgi:hypothetical protein
LSAPVWEESAMIGEILTLLIVHDRQKGEGCIKTGQGYEEKMADGSECRVNRGFKGFGKASGNRTRV